MEECSPASVLPNEDLTSDHGPLYRARLVVLGLGRCGKTSLVQSLLHVAPHTQDTPTEGVNMHIWHPFREDGLQRQLSRKLTGEEDHLVVEVWDTTGRQVCQAVHALFLSTRTVCIIVYDVTDSGCVDRVLALYSILQQKGVSTPVVIAGTKTDCLDHASASEEARLKERIHQTLKQYSDAHLQEVLAEANDIRKLLKELRRPPDKEETNSSKRQTQATGSGDDVSEEGLRLRVEALEQTLSQTRATPRFQDVSSATGKGLHELRKVLLEVVLETVEDTVAPLPVRQSTIALYNQILALRENECVVFPWKQFQELIKNDDRSISGDFDEELWHLEAIGVVRDCRVPCVTFPKADLDPEGEKTLVAPGDDGDRYICIHPAVLASAICLCLLDDDKKSFRFEAARFWPRDSGFKHPEPQLLSRVIECIPQQGLLRECLLPLFWQEYSLQQEQVLAMLQVMMSLGLLVPHGDQKNLCEGLAMPAFPKLSVQRCYALTLLNLLPDNKPQLNWTAKPFAGDMQVTWRLTLSSPVHHGLLQRLLSTVLFAGRADCNYHHVWRTGVLLRVGEATVCAEQLEESHLELSCRVNEADVGREKEAVCVLWVTLAPFLTHVHTFLRDWPGVTFRESLLALGQQFYHDSSMEREPEVGVEHVLTLWQRRLPLIFTDGGTERQLDVALLLPFKPVPMVTSVQAWLTLVIGQTERILKEAAATSFAESSSPSPLLLTTLVPKKGPSSRGAIKYQKKKKSMEVKWHLEESKALTNPTNSTAKGGYLTPGSAATTTTTTTTTTTISSFTSLGKDNSSATSNGLRPSRVLSDEEEVAETMRLASSFVAAILASALADYVSMEVGNDKLGSSLLSAAQASAARATADAAQAAQTGNIEGAALAVIEAVKAVQVSATGKSEVKVDTSPMQSRLCVIL